MFKMPALLLLLILALHTAPMALSAPASRTGECLILASNKNNQRILANYDHSLRLVFSTAGICATFVSLPQRQLEWDISQGKIDGEFLRVKTYIDRMKEYVISVPTPVFRSVGVIATRADSGFKPQDVSNINKHPIGIIQGFSWQEIIAKQLKNVKRSKSYLNLILSLKAKHIDGFLVAEPILDGLISKGIFKKEEVFCSKPVANLSLYIVLHKKNAGLVKRLDAALKELKDAGHFKLP